MKKLLLFCMMLPLIAACNNTTKTAAAVLPTQHKMKAEDYPTMQYVFRAKVRQSRVVDKGRGAAAGKFPVEQLIAEVSEVAKGADIQPGQEIFIEIEAKKTSCTIGDTCKVIAPYKHPAVQKSVLILKATIIP